MNAAAEALALRVASALAVLPEAASYLREFPPLTPPREERGGERTPIPVLHGERPGVGRRRATTPRRLPVCAQLPKLPPLASPSTRALVEKLVPAANELEWRQTYGENDFGADFLNNYGWTELIGLRGPIASERVACGFLFLGPHTEYPAHAHEAEELYWPLAGEALWMRDGGDFVARGPGEPIAHPSWMPHAMRTRDAPMLALYLWRGGDLAAKSKIFPR